MRSELPEQWRTVSPEQQAYLQALQAARLPAHQALRPYVTALLLLQATEGRGPRVPITGHHQAVLPAILPAEPHILAAGHL